MAIKTHDICSSIGKYTDSTGNTKNRYINIGSVWKGDNGTFIRLNRWINIAGIPFKEGSDSVLCSIFPVKNKNSDNNDFNNSQSSQSQSSDFSSIDDIPF